METRTLLISNLYFIYMQICVHRDKKPDNCESIFWPQSLNTIHLYSKFAHHPPEASLKWILLPTHTHIMCLFSKNNSAPPEWLPVVCQVYQCTMMSWCWVHTSDHTHSHPACGLRWIRFETLNHRGQWNTAFQPSVKLFHNQLVIHPNILFTQSHVCS